MTDAWRPPGPLLATDLEPGIRFHDGTESPEALAERLGAELARTPGEVASIVQRNLARVTPTQIDELARLVTRVEVAGRVVERTRQRAAVVVAERLAGAAGAELAIHPSAYRDAAARVRTARDTVAEANAELVEHERELDALRRELPEADGAALGTSGDHAPISGDAEAAADVEDEVDVRRTGYVTPRGRMLRRRSFGAISVALGLGMVAFAAAGVPLWLALVPTLVVCLVVMWLLRERGARHATVGAAKAGDPGDVHEHLAAVAAAADEAFGARRRSELAQADRTELLVARRDRAAEDLRVAEQAWRDLAGPDADPDDVDDVIRRRDPQHREALVLAAETATVRAASALLERSLERWSAAWSDLGLAVPESVDAAAVDDLRARAARRVVLAGAAAGHAHEVAAARPAAPIIVVREWR